MAEPTYTDEQIQAVCNKAADALKGLTDVQNITFPSTAIISGIKQGLSADEIAANARKAIDGLPMFNNGTYNTVGSSLNLFNLSSYMAGVVRTEVNKLYATQDSNGNFHLGGNSPFGGQGQEENRHAGEE